MKRLVAGLSAYLAGGLVAGLVLECVLRLLPVPMGLYRTEEYQRWPLQNYESHLRYRTSMAWDLRNARSGSSNNYGQLAPFDFRPGSHPVIVIGDSFVDGQMNWYADTLQGQLGDLLGKQDAVYGLGANGLSISDYLAVSKMATAEFAPAAAVFLIIDGDVSESLLHQTGHYNLVVQGDTVELEYLPLFGETLGKQLRRTIGDSALLRYVQFNLHFDPARILARWFAPAAIATPAAAQRRPMEPAEKKIIDYFVAQLGPTLDLPPSCITLLFHSDTYAIANPAEVVALKDSFEVQRYFTAQARQAGYHVVELAERFREDYAARGQRLDFWPLDRHLNGRGHRVAARAAFDSLFANGLEQCRPGSPPGGR